MVGCPFAGNCCVGRRLLFLLFLQDPFQRLEQGATAGRIDAEGLGGGFCARRWVRLCAGLGGWLGVLLCVRLGNWRIARLWPIATS